VVALLPLAGCVGGPRTIERKEVYVEPGEEAQKELERLPHLVHFPLPDVDQPRAYSFARRLQGDEPPRGEMGEEGEKKPDHPPTALVFPDRIDVREASGCYLGHCSFLARNGASVIHHVRLLVVNRERTLVTIPVSSFVLLGDMQDGNGPVPLTFLVAATDRSIKIPAAMEVPPGEQRLAHFFYAEKARVSPVLEVRWSATVDDGHGGVASDATMKGELVRRYVAPNAPLSPLEDRVARGLLDLPEPNGSRGDWLDPGLSAVPGGGGGD
jgi:hypothetical protein